MSKEAKVYAAVSDVLYVDKNTLRYWAVCAVGIFIGYGIYGSILLSIVLNVSFAIIIDAMYYIYGIAYYCPSESIARGYSLSGCMNDTLHSEGIDYGFNFYDGDYKKSPSTAQIDKFKYAVKTIGITKGDRVIDIGCGCGDWLYYLQTEMECKVVGVNITRVQAIECHKRGLDCHVTDWKLIEKREDLKRLLYGQFDAVTAWDTVEHYVSMGEGLGRRHNRNKIYQQLFRLVRNLLDDKSKIKKVWVSCLHMRIPIWSKDGINLSQIITKFKKGAYCYFLDKFHSGFYPSYYNDSDGVFYDGLVDNAKKVGFNLSWRKDVTMDYYMTSKLNETHFGRHRFILTPLRTFVILANMLIDPYWLQRMLWFAQESWMDQFDTKDIDNSDVILWWLVWQWPGRNKK